MAPSGCFFVVLSYRHVFFYFLCKLRYDIKDIFCLFQICFFKSTSPEEVLKDSSSQGEITQWLTQLCPPEGNRPWLECCVCSYTGLSGVCYKIIDTTIA